MKITIWLFDWLEDTISCWAVIIIWSNFTLQEKLKLLILLLPCISPLVYKPLAYKPIKKASELFKPMGLYTGLYGVMFFEMFRTVTSPVPVKSYQPIPLWEVYLLSKFGKCSILTSRNMTYKQNHKTKSILCHQHLRGIPLRLFTKRCIFRRSFVTVINYLTKLQ